MARPRKPDLTLEEIQAIHSARKHYPKHGSGWTALAAMITNNRAGDVATPSIRNERSVSARWVKDQYESRINGIQEILALPQGEVASREILAPACESVNRASTNQKTGESL